MDVSCPACAAKYTADEEKLRGKTARMRCKACNTAWMVTGPGATGAPAAAAVSVPPPSEAKRAKTGSERENKDLFAARGADDIHGSVKESPNVSSQAKDTLLPPPAFGFAGGTGSRSENSVLFRVDQLANVANVGGRIKTPEPESLEALGRAQTQLAPITPRGGDEEGVIDLRALASVPPPGKRSFVPVAPLFSEPPPALAFDSSGPSASRPAITKPISKGKLFAAIAAAAAFLVVAGLGISVAFKGEEPVKHAAAAAAPPPPPPPPTVEKAPEPPPAEKTAANDEDSAKKGAKKGKRKGTGGKAGGSSTAAAPQTKKAADPCGCKGDFTCILACTAKNGH